MNAKVELMRPTIHIQLQVRKIVQDDYSLAAADAYYELTAHSETREVMSKSGYTSLATFFHDCRVAKELDGTYTVTLP